MSQAEFLKIVTDWLATSKNPRFKRPYTELVYQPMREVRDYLRANEFKTYIVTGGGQDFVRAYAQKVYGVPPEQVVGSSITTKYEIKDGTPEIVRLPKLFSTMIMRARRLGSTCSSADVPMPPLATPPAIARCWNGLAREKARG